MVMEGRVDQHELLVQEVKYNAEWAKKSSCPGLFRCQDNFIMVEWNKVTDLVMGGIKIMKLVKANMRMFVCAGWQLQTPAWRIHFFGRNY